MTQPSDLLTGFIISLLTPIFMSGGITDVDLARRAATETIAAYGTATANQLIAMAQATAFALASVDNLRLSMPADLALSTKLRLRGNANALNRTSQQAAATLNTGGEPAPNPTAQPEIAADRDVDLSWASAMTEVATEFTAELPQLEPAQRRTHLTRIHALSEIAHTLASAGAPPLKSRLLGSTSLLTPSPLPPTASLCTPMASPTYR